MSLVASPLYPG